MKRRLSLAIGVMFTALLALPHAAWSGAGDLDEDQEEGVPFFGFVRDTKGATVPDARVTADFKSGGARLITRSDGAGAYNVSAFGAETDPKDVEITCIKDGYTYKETVRRDPSVKAGQPVEADCFLVKQ
jgi:hypothetical protein